MPGFLQYLTHRKLQDAVSLFLGLIVSLPLWVVSRPPLQDLPQHVAAVRVLSSYWDPTYRFGEYFELTLGRTQYLSVYLLAALLAKVTGPLVATKCVLTLSLATTPYCLMRLLRGLRQSAWLALLSLPLVYNVHVAFGFLNFVAGIPLLFFGLELAAKESERSTRRGTALLASVLLLTFYTHVVPFGILASCVLVFAVWQRRDWIRHVLVLLPSGCVALLWLVTSPAGQVVSAMGRNAAPGETVLSFQTFGAALRALPDWMIDISSTDRDAQRLVAWGLTVTVLWLLATVCPEPRPYHVAPTQTSSDKEPDADHAVGSDDASCATGVVGSENGPEVCLARSEAFPVGSDGAEASSRGGIACSSVINSSPRGLVVVGLVLPGALIAYFALPAANNFIWPICQRFPLLAALFVIPLLGRAPGWARAVGAIVAVFLSLSSTTELCATYQDVEARSYSGFDDVLAEVPNGSRVAALIFDRNVEGLRLSPLMHAAGWVQADRGGVVMFSFAEFPPSPFTYRPSRRPPKVPPRWEWVPDRVNPDRDLGYYEYVLVHGWTGSLQTSRLFREVRSKGRWSLWKRVTEPVQVDSTQ